MNKTFIVLILHLCFLTFQIECFAKTLHAILIADNLHDITLFTQADLYNIQNELRKISKHAQCILKEKVFLGLEFEKEKIMNYVKNLHVEPTDSIVFYFSGHGYRTMQKQTLWPFLSFELYKIGLDMQWVVDTLWGKKPQFTLIMADCCNNFAERGINTETKQIHINLHQKETDSSGYRQLFVNAKGCVVICSSSVGQFSYGSKYGGIFTMCFLSSLNKEIGEPSPSWKNLFLRASAYMKHIQKPICQIYSQRN